MIPYLNLGRGGNRALRLDKSQRGGPREVALLWPAELGAALNRGRRGPLGS